MDQKLEKKHWSEPMNFLKRKKKTKKQKKHKQKKTKK